MGVLVVFILNVLMKQREGAPPFAVWLQLFNVAAINYLYTIPSVAVTTGSITAFCSRLPLALTCCWWTDMPRCTTLNDSAATTVGWAVLPLFRFLHAWCFTRWMQSLAVATAFPRWPLDGGVSRRTAGPQSARLPWLLVGCGGMGVLLLLPLLRHGH